MNPRSVQPRRLLRAAAIADAAGVQAAPGAVLVEVDRIVAAGTPQSIGPVADAIVEDHANSIIVPALANAHTHLDLTHLGPRPFDGDFTTWVDAVRTGRARSDEDIAESVRAGVRLSLAGGVAMVGDIAGVRSVVPTITLRQSGMAGVSFFEIFGMGRAQSAAIDAMRSAAGSIPHLERGVRLGVQPHAPYSCGPEVYRAAASLGLPLATHLAETRDELEFVDRGLGPLADMLKRIGIWDDSITGFGVHAIDHIIQLLTRRPFIAAHVNYIDDRHMTTLAKSPVTVAYCPRASAYFGHLDHRYREMLAAGVNVALGTDSILCLDTADRISTLDEMRLLHQRDGTGALDLLCMATINGAQALGIRESLATLAPGPSAGLLALTIDPPMTTASEALAGALRRTDPPRWVLGPFEGDDAWLQHD